MFLKATGSQAKQFDTADLETTLALQLETISRQGINALETEELAKYNGLLQEVNTIFTTTELCESKGQKICMMK